jgi:hypothetical protein
VAWDIRLLNKENNMKIGQLMESRIAAMAADRSRLINSWAPIIEAAQEYVKGNGGKDLTPLMKANIARCCENALLDASQGRSQLFEATTGANIQFLGIQLPVIAALLPSLALNELATVQALERRVGGIFYLNVNYGSTKGGVTANTTMMSPITGQYGAPAGRNYASQVVQGEVAYAIGASGAAQSYTLQLIPVIPGSVTVQINGGLQNLNDSAQATYNSTATSATLASDTSGYAGSITYSTGVLLVTFKTTTTAVTTVAYQYNYQTSTSLANTTPEVNFNITQATLTAIDYPLRATYTLASAIDLERAHGLSLEDEMVKYLGGEVKFAQDHYGMDQIVAASKLSTAAAGGYLGSYSAAPSTGETWIWKKFQFMDWVEKANNAIIAQTLRMQCTWILTGNNGARLIRQLAPHFVLASGVGTQSVTGPYVLGTLDGRTVVHDPFMNINDVVFGYKGQNWTEAAFAYAPYIPLLTTPTLVTADLKSQKGFLSSSAYQVINAGAFCYSTVSGLS